MARSLAERLRAHEQQKARLAEQEAKLKDALTILLNYPSTGVNIGRRYGLRFEADPQSGA
jgi:hypothetical protein